MKKTIITIIALLCVCGADAQILGGTFTLSGKEITTKAVEKAICVTSLSYKITNKESGKSFGRNGKDEFNSVLAMAVKTEDGIMMHGSAFKPWQNDPDFNKYESEYDGVLTQISYCTIGDSIFVPAAIPTSPNASYDFIDSQTSGGLIIDDQKGNKNGWIIWVTTDETGKGISSKVKIDAQKFDINITDSTTRCKINTIPKNTNIIGGIYVEPNYIGEGTVQYRMIGFVEKVISNWFVYVPFKTSKVVAHSKVEPIKSDDTLTEIPDSGKSNDSQKKKSKKKK